jgi:hypothetical protein
MGSEGIRIADTLHRPLARERESAPGTPSLRADVCVPRRRDGRERPA